MSEDNNNDVDLGLLRTLDLEVGQEAAEIAIREIEAKKYVSGTIHAGIMVGAVKIAKGLVQFKNPCSCAEVGVSERDYNRLPNSEVKERIGSAVVKKYTEYLEDKREKEEKSGDLFKCHSLTVKVSFSFDLLSEQYEVTKVVIVPLIIRSGEASQQQQQPLPSPAIFSGLVWRVFFLFFLFVCLFVKVK